ncbi:hypothetical protein O6H91_16G078000 [Diphasiastrum complanatum]|uniref:Uncharacterized protein n=2 Tax=Diphasiastrum complanatum TaxID=34168 RepID=A0ACC2BDM7_DIPCM|nr:hypothetical protein O6H91_16G072600 [Diphasiastrum complanatum]KAJ7527954.1 hypothetical protein O6H91_16G078000 [Diphasiastrum complanatum]
METVYGLVAAGLILLFTFCKFLFPRKYRKLNLPLSPPAWPIIGHLHLLGPLPHQALSEQAQKHGPLLFLWLGSVPTIVASNASTARECLRTYDQIFASRPAKTESVQILSSNHIDMGWTDHGPLWRHFRKICKLELFSPKKMEASKHVRREEVSSMLKSLLKEGEGGKVVSVSSQVFDLTRNVITRMVLNTKYFVSGSAEALEFQKTVYEYFQLNGVFVLGDYLPFMAWLDFQGYKRRMKIVHERLDAMMDKIVQEHRDLKLGASINFIDVLLAVGQDDGNERFGIDNIKALVSDMITTGSDTSSITIIWGIAEILRNPSVLEKAHQELDRIVGRERIVEEDDIPQLKYLQAIVKETFRLHPAVPLLVPHESTQAVQIAGYDIPAKSRLLVNAWAIGRDPSSWEKPLEFFPDRFLNNTIDIRGKDYELIPFGSGRRGCPGLELGLINVQLGMAALLQSFNWSLPYPQRPADLDMTELFGLTLPRASPLCAVATPRLPRHLYCN